MCTLTFTGAALAPDAGTEALDAGYALLFNRDELRTRAPELAPTQQLTESALRYLSPTDGEAGGTWITVNERGVTVALLNGYIVSRGETPESWTSRGELVRSLADLGAAGELPDRLSVERLASFRPSVIVAVGLGEHPVIARWDGLDLSIDGRADLALPITSSSYEQDAVQRFRQELYAREVGPRNVLPAFERLDAFHCWTEPAGPDAMSPCMAREDAATRSQCRIFVGGGTVRFDYLSHPPHKEQTPVSSSLQLMR